MKRPTLKFKLHRFLVCQILAIKGLLQAEPETTEINCSDLTSDEQLKDQELVPIIMHLKDGTLPEDVKLAKNGC